MRIGFLCPQQIETILNLILPEDVSAKQLNEGTETTAYGYTIIAAAVIATIIILFKTFKRFRQYNRVLKIIGIIFDLGVVFYSISVVVLSRIVGGTTGTFGLIYFIALIFGLLLRPRQQYT